MKPRPDLLVRTCLRTRDDLSFTLDMAAALADRLQQESVKALTPGCNEPFDSAIRATRHQKKSPHVAIWSARTATPPSAESF